MLRIWKIVFLSSFLQSAVLALDCTVDAAQEILPSGATALRALSLPDNSTFGDPTEVAYPDESTNLPALCLLTINATSSPTSSYRFGLLLPEDWNGRFAAVGNGGLAGGINWPSMGVMVKYGFAVVSTDTGHNGTAVDGRFTLNGNETIADNAYRAMHGSIVHAKDVVEAYYGRNISYSYYNGCSTGGRQGLVELQMYPEDFDGLLVGAPAWESTKIAPYIIQQGMMNLPNTSAHHIPPALFPLVQKEAMRQCDGVDGVEDGVITDPQICHFHPETLLCTEGQNTSSCLTDPQINTLHLLYGHHFDIARPLFYHSLPVGSEAGWTGFLPADAPLILGTAAFAYVRMQDPNWDWHDVNISLVAEKELTANRQGIPENFSAVKKFADRGGKLLHYHGLADPILPYGTSQTFYEAVYRNITSTVKDYTVDDFYRLFYVPGMLHCSGANGDAPWYFGAGSGPELLGSGVHGVPGFEDAEHDAVLALMKWVENDEAPAWITATKFVNETIEEGVKRQRKLCKYPKVAKFVGDDVDDAASWEC